MRYLKSAADAGACVFTGSLVLSLCSTAFAQDGSIQEVVVTAQKREEMLQTAPLSISAMPAEALSKMGVTDFSGVAKATPSISWAPYPSAPNTLVVFMRGQGFTNPVEITSDAAVGIYQDGFYISRPQGLTFDLADVERVEVLRGPQGTLYGRNTTGGAINIISREPSGEFAFKQNLTFGSRNQFRNLTSVDLPAWQDIAAKVSVVKSSKDGYVKNPGSGHDFGEEGQLAGRMALHWQGSDDLAANYFYEQGELESTALYFQNPAVATAGIFPGYTIRRDRAYRAVDLPLTNTRFASQGLTLTWDASETLTLKSLTGYRSIDAEVYQDYAEAFFVPFINQDEIGSHQFSQELQLIGEAFDNRVEYIVGLYYFKEASSHFARVVTATAPVGGIQVIKDRDIDADSESKALYTQVTWTPAVAEDRLSLTFGARYTADDRDAARDAMSAMYPPASAPIDIGSEIDATNSQDFKRFNPTFTASYNWSDDLTTYAKLATGYKAGGSSEGADIGRFGVTYGPEEITSYEFGLKSYWWDRHVRFNLAAFRTDYEDMQMAFVVNAVDPSVIQALNAGQSTIDGVELDVLIQPTADLSLSLDYSYLDPDIEKIKAPAGTLFDPAANAGSPYAVGDNIASLFTLPYAPKSSYNVAVDYTFLRLGDATFSGRVSYRRTDEFTTTAAASQAVPGADFYTIPAYGLLDARLTASFDLPRGDRARVALWGKNITDRKYQAFTTGLGLPLPNVGYGSGAYALGEPASYGVDLSYEY